MFDKMLTENSRRKLLIAATVAAFLPGSGIAVAQMVDDPPGSLFQTQKIREAEGLRGVPSPYIRAARAAAAARQARAYAYVPVPAVPHHKVVRRHR